MDKVIIVEIVSVVFAGVVFTVTYYKCNVTVTCRSLILLTLKKKLVLFS